MDTNKFYTYILISNNRKHTYTGSTFKKPKVRLFEHNSGKVKSSRHYAPYEILNVEEFDSFIEARRKEFFYKTTTGRRKIKELIQGEPRQIFVKNLARLLQNFSKKNFGEVPERSNGVAC